MTVKSLNASLNPRAKSPEQARAGGKRCLLTGIKAGAGPGWCGKALQVMCSGRRRAWLSCFWVDQTCRCDYSPQSSFFATQLDDNHVISALMKQGKYIPHAPTFCPDISVEMQIITVCSGGNANPVPKCRSADTKLLSERISFLLESAEMLSECFPTELIQMKCWFNFYRIGLFECEDQLLDFGLD